MRFYRCWRRVQALSFDLDDTIYENHSAIAEAEAWLTQELKERFVETTHLNAHHWQRYRHQTLKRSPQLSHDVSACRLAWLTMGLEDSGVLNADKQAQQLMRDFIWVRSNIQVPQSNLNTLDRLAEHYPMIAITNGNVDVDQIGLRKYFKHVLRPGQGLRRKPFPDLFSLAHQVLDVAHHQMAHVGDHPRTDVAGALYSGVRPIWLNIDGVADSPSLLPDVELNSLQELEALLCP